MSLFRKLIGRRSQTQTPEKSASEETAQNTENNAAPTSPKEQNNSISKMKKCEDAYMPYLPESKRTSISSEEPCDESDIKESESSDSGSAASSDCADELIFGQRNKRLTAKLTKLKKQRDRLKRRQNDVISLEKEIRQVITMITRTRLESEALREDLLIKKCELKFLSAQVPEGFEAEAKRKEPLFFKKYTSLKTLNDTKNLLVSIREKMRALQYLELLTHNKMLEYQHGLKKNPVKKVFGQMSQKSGIVGNFDHVADCIKRGPPLKKKPEKIYKHNDSQATDDLAVTTVTIESPPVSASSPEVTPRVLVNTTPPPPPPTSQQQIVFQGPFSPLRPRLETFL